MASLKYYLGLQVQSPMSKLYRDHFLSTIASFKLLSDVKLPSESTINTIKKNCHSFNEQQGLRHHSISLVFDIDETLVHVSKKLKESDFTLPVRFRDGSLSNLGVFIRPYAREMLSNLSKHFELISFTASAPEYANKILQLLDPERKIFSFNFFRNDCFPIEQNLFVKDLRIINRPVSRIVLVDDNPISYGFQKDNGVPIVPFKGNPEDGELILLEQFLLTLQDVDDVRIILKKHFQLSKIKGNYGIYKNLSFFTST